MKTVRVARKRKISGVGRVAIVAIVVLLQMMDLALPGIVCLA